MFPSEIKKKTMEYSDSSLSGEKITNLGLIFLNVGFLSWRGK